MFAYVGGYTTVDRNGHGDGINVYRIDAPDGPWVHLHHVESFDNPSFLRISPDGRTLFAAHGGRDCVSAYTIDLISGDLRLINRVGSGGDNPVDLGFDAEGRTLVVAHYSSGTVSVMPIAGDGALAEPSQVLHLSGKLAALPHGVTPDASGRFVVVPDKGLDLVFVYRFEAGVLRETCAAATAPGAGPRHAAFHPRLDVLYVINELDSCVQSFRWHEGVLVALQSVSGLPAGVVNSFASEIAVAACGSTLYTSNRGHDSISRFSIDGDGLLTFCDCTPIQGREPRFFVLDPSGDFLHVGNQATDAIVTFRIDAADGRLHDGRVTVQVGTPTAICFLPSSASQI